MHDACEREIVRHAHLEQAVHRGEHQRHEARAAAAARRAVRALGALVPLEHEAGHAAVGELEAPNAHAAGAGADASSRRRLRRRVARVDGHEGESGALRVEHVLCVEAVQMQMVHRGVAA